MKGFGFIIFAAFLGFIVFQQPGHNESQAQSVSMELQKGFVVIPAADAEDFEQEKVEEFMEKPLEDAVLLLSGVVAHKAKSLPPRKADDMVVTLLRSGK